MLQLMTHLVHVIVFIFCHSIIQEYRTHHKAYLNTFNPTEKIIIPLWIVSIYGNFL